VNVYPVNAIEGASLTSPQLETYSQINDIYNRYIDFTVDFTEPLIELNGNWAEAVDADSFIIGNTNAEFGAITLRLFGEIVLEKAFETKNNINIVDLEGPKVFNEIILTISGLANIQIGLLFIGNKWELPRFATLPEKALATRNDSGRTFTGQSTGIPVTTLKAFTASYIRIPNEKVKTINDYINGVQTIIPHVIDPYPQAHEEFPPFFATVTEYSGKEKRAENGFYWNFEIAWMEAK